MAHFFVPQKVDSLIEFLIAKKRSPRETIIISKIVSSAFTTIQIFQKLVCLYYEEGNETQGPPYRKGILGFD